MLDQRAFYVISLVGVALECSRFGGQIGNVREVRLEIRRTPTDTRIRNANAQWAPINAIKGDFFSLFKYQTAPGTLVGSFVRAGHDQDGLWTEYQALYFYDSSP